MIAGTSQNYQFAGFLREKKNVRRFLQEKIPPALRTCILTFIP